MMLKIQLAHPEYTSDVLVDSVRDILDSNTLMALATVRDCGESHINTAFFCFDETMRLYFMSHRQAIHSCNIRSNGSAAVAVYDSHQSFMSAKRGLQIFGKARAASLVESGEAIRLYLRRFPEFASVLGPAGLAKATLDAQVFTIRPVAVKVLDEARFGHHKQVTCTVVVDGYERHAPVPVLEAVPHDVSDSCRN
jgi:uncharacterized protein YhbP (UPF0306 family)